MDADSGRFLWDEEFARMKTSPSAVTVQDSIEYLELDLQQFFNWIPRLEKPRKLTGKDAETEEEYLERLELAKRCREKFVPSIVLAIEKLKSLEGAP